jgi:O-antigen/teichoic acid export membrane protein
MKSEMEAPVLRQSDIWARFAAARSSLGGMRKSSLLHLFVLADQALVSGSNFALGVLLTRKLSLAEVGQYWLLMAIFFFGGTAQMALIVAPMMSIGPLQRNFLKKSYLGAVIAHEYTYVAVYSLLSLFLLMALKISHIGVRTEWIVPLLVASAAYLLQDFFRRVLFYQRRPLAGFSTDAVSYLGQIGIFWFLLSRGALSLSSIFWINAATSVLAICSILIWIPAPIWRIAIFRSVFRRNWTSSRYLLGAAVLQWCSGSLFGLVAPAFLGTAVAGVMRACQSLMNATNIWTQGLENSLPSQASERFRAAGARGLRAYLWSASGILVGGTSIIAAVVIAAPNFWLRLLYGDRLKGYGYVLQAFALLAVCTVAALPLRAGLRAMEQAKPILTGYIISAIYSGIAAPLVPLWFGLKGVSVGLVLTQAILLPVLIYFLQRSLANVENRQFSK